MAQLALFSVFPPTAYMQADYSRCILICVIGFEIGLDLTEIEPQIRYLLPDKADISQPGLKWLVVLFGPIY